MCINDARFIAKSNILGMDTFTDEVTFTTLLLAYNLLIFLVNEENAYALPREIKKLVWYNWQSIITDPGQLDPDLRDERIWM